MGGKIPVCAYCRVSTKDTDQLNSLEYQTNYYKVEIEKNKNYKLFEIYADRGLSATSWKKREQFKKMIYDAGLNIHIIEGEYVATISNREPKFKRILVKDVSRFTRNINAMEIITKLKEKGVFVDFTTLNLSTETMSVDMILGMLVLLAQQDSKDRSVKVLFGQREGAKKGVIKTADNFYGYKYVKETNSLEIVKHEAEVIKKIFELYVYEKFGFRKILKYLEENKIFTRKGKPFVQTSIKRMLENPAYKGTLVRNKMDSPLVFTSKTYATLKPEEEWIVKENRIPAIVSSELWEQAQEIKRSKTCYVRRVGKNSARSEFAGLIKCGKCGNVYNQDYERRTNRYFYKCSLKKKKGIKFCSSPNVDKKVFTNAIIELCNNGLHDGILKDKEAQICSIKDKIADLESKINQQDNEEMSIMNHKLSELYDQKKRLAVLFLQKTLSEQDLLQMQKEIDDEISEITKQIEIKSLDNNQIYDKVSNLQEIIKDIKNIPIKKHYTPEEVKAQIKSIIVEQINGQTRIDIQFKIFEDIKNIVGHI
ncbi:recombinase family protein [Paenibacillus elgii]|uniref:recombinase family protein n=1 Tax=Paenibacillus elgii TaxID=189691 RepID=UPI00203CFA6A|nr:recombinase family protein [Paenibacillus elgii]MCM3272124.1 recombinase family protein [Paenibacillus elgii]